MKGRKKNYNGPWYMKLVPMLHGYLALAAAAVALQILMLILVNAPTLKWLTLPLVFVYFGVLLAIVYLLMRRKELVELHALMGDELFYECYPAERRRAERRSRRIAKQKARRDCRVKSKG